MPGESDGALGAALSRLRSSLGPFVEEAVGEAERSGRIVKGDALRAAGLASDSGLQLGELPLDQLLRVMFLTWNAAFATRLNAAHRNATSGLRSIVDRVAAGAVLTPSERERAAERVALLLSAATTTGTGVEPRLDGDQSVRAEPSDARSAAVAVDGATAARSSGVDAEPRIAPETGLPPVRLPDTTRGTPADPPGSASRSRDPANQDDRPARIVCWMKPDEARVVLSAYIATASQEVTTSEGWIIAAEWNAPDSEAAQKYRAEVCMIRFGRSKERGKPKRLWIRREEAEAVLEAYRSRASVPFEHRTHGSGGCAQFHPDDAEETKKYLANVMLKRYS